MYKIFLALFVLWPGFLALAADNSTEQPKKMAQKETIAVLGTGDMGDSFGPQLARLGYRVIYGSRNPGSKRVLDLVAKTGYGASADSNANAARTADIILLAVAAHAVEVVVRSFTGIDGKIVIDLTWPPSRVAEDGYDEITIGTSGAERIQEWLPNAFVVKAFGTLGSNVIDNPNVAGGSVTVPIASDHRRAKEAVARIAVDLGLDPVDAGPLRMARHIESMMLLYMVPHYQGRPESWEFYFRRSNYWNCNEYTGGELDEDAPAVADADNLADIPVTQPSLSPCIK